MPDEPLDPIEALRHIRTFVDAAMDRVEDPLAAGTFREIASVLDRALPKPKRSARKPKDGA